MAADFLTDPNEDQEAADFYMKKFQQEGALEGSALNLVVRVTKIPSSKLNAVESKILKLYDCSRIERGESGFLFKKASITAYLHPIKFERNNLLLAARALYRLILEDGVTVEITSANMALNLAPLGRSATLKHRWLALRYPRSAMKRPKSNDIPAWKQILAGCAGMYFLVVWALPIFMSPFVSILPYVHHMDFLHRLIVSISFSFLAVGILYSLDPKNFLSIYRSGSADSSKWKRTKHGVGLLVGFTMFTYAGADLSPNLFGALTRVFPSSEYEKTVEIVNAELSGSKYKFVSLTLKDDEDGKVLYLVLAKRLFDYPRFKAGDTLRLHGMENFVGAYVTDFKIVGNRLTTHSGGSPSATAEFNR
jgi:hypothetical protein